MGAILLEGGWGLPSGIWLFLLQLPDLRRGQARRLGDLLDRPFHLEKIQRHFLDAFFDFLPIDARLPNVAYL